MSDDLTHVLASWNYSPEHNTRIIEADDGRQVLQVRLPLGIEQYELDGRPDGGRPLGHDTFLDVLKERLETWRSEHGTDRGFTLKDEDVSMLQGEGILFYYRYLMLFQMDDFVRVERDTGHNLELTGFFEKYVEDEENRNAVLQFKPYIIRMHAMSRAMKLVERMSHDDALAVLESAVDHIESLPAIDTPAFSFERLRSINYLRASMKQIAEREPDEEKKLQEELQRAVDEENYERAAQIRDQLRDLGRP